MPQEHTPQSETDEPGDPAPDVSDVVLAEDTTGAAPSFPAPSPAPGAASPQAVTEKFTPAKDPAHRDRAPLAMLPGAKVDDFEIVRMLGRGAFGHVYLARQLSLDRLVALKVSANRGSEGRTMARLEHRHIVQVYSEKVEPDFNQRLLCMQLVPGIGMEKLIEMLHPKHSEGHPRDSRQDTGSGERAAKPGRLFRSRRLKPLDTAWNGAQLLAIIDRSASLPAALDPSALHDRDALERMDAIEAAAWFGARLAEALDFAHHHGVLHRDIKPANILVDPYGRPLLADFNISSQPVGSEPGGEEMFGGTFAYMSPEHLDAFNPSDPTPNDAVTARSDIYSLGLVLQQLLDGWMTVPMPSRRTAIVETLRVTADERRNTRTTCRAGPPGARMVLERTISRCVEPLPDDRFASGAELGEQLDGCRRLRQAERQLPHVRTPFQPILRRPFLWLIILVVLPQLIGSAVNITYNASQIVEKLSEAQQELFNRLVFAYNAVVYPPGLILLGFVIWPVWQCWRALSRAEPVDLGEVESARRKALRSTKWIAAIVALGWFPGGVLFPLVIQALEPPLSNRITAHFIASFWMSGLIALAYSLCGVKFIVIRVLYPGLWHDVRGYNHTADRELAPISRHLLWIQFLAGSIPLVAAATIVLAGDTASVTFRLLVVALIFLGIVGSYVTNVVTRGLSQVVAALTSTKA